MEDNLDNIVSQGNPVWWNDRSPPGDQWVRAGKLVGLDSLLSEQIDVLVPG